MSAFVEPVVTEVLVFALVTVVTVVAVGAFIVVVSAQVSENGTQMLISKHVISFTSTLHLNILQHALNNYLECFTENAKKLEVGEQSN